MSFNKVSGSVVSLDALDTALRSFLLTTLGWTEEHTGVKNGRTWRILKSLGESGAEAIYVGYYTAKRTNDLCSIELQMYTGAPNLGTDDFFNQPGAIWQACYATAWYTTMCGYCFIPFTALRDGAMTYWFFGDQDSILGIIKIDSYYLSFYLGKMTTYQALADEPYPMMAIGNARGLDWPNGYCWACSTYNNPFWASVASAVRCSKARNRANSAWLDLAFEFGTNPSPTIQVVFDRLAHVTYEPNGRSGGYLLHPQHVIAYNEGWRGYLRHCFQIGGAGLAAESLLDVNGNEYIVFPNSYSVTPPESLRWLAVRNYL